MAFAGSLTSRLAATNGIIGGNTVPDAGNNTGGNGRLLLFSHRVAHDDSRQANATPSSNTESFGPHYRHPNADTSTGSTGGTPGGGRDEARGAARTAVMAMYVGDVSQSGNVTAEREDENIPSPRAKTMEEWLNDVAQETQTASTALQVRQAQSTIGEIFSQRPTHSCVRCCKQQKKQRIRWRVI